MTDSHAYYVYARLSDGSSQGHIGTTATMDEAETMLRRSRMSGTINREPAPARFVELLSEGMNWRLAWQQYQREKAE